MGDGRVWRGALALALALVAGCARAPGTAPPATPRAGVEIPHDEPPSFERARHDSDRAKYWKLIEKSSFGPNAAETRLLDRNGFLVTGRQHHQSFLEGYRSIFKADLPVYVSADVFLDVLYRSYDELLTDVETAILIEDVGTWLDSARQRLKAGHASGFGKVVEADVDLYLAVAATLLEPGRRESRNPTVELPVRGAEVREIQELVAAASRATGILSTKLFGTWRDVDFSQFKPRAHYAKTRALQAYFRAMMWLGRVDFRLTTVSPGHQVEMQRRQLEGALALRDLAEPETKRWRRVDELLRVFVGERDSASMPEMERFLDELGASSGVEVKRFSDQEIAAALERAGTGQQRIGSHVSYTSPTATKTKPRHLSFVPFGQRYVVDSEGLGAVTFDRILAKRFLPSPLDAAYATLGNNHAYTLLEPELKQYDYGEALRAFRKQTDELPEQTWNQNLYNAWLGSLRELSPPSEPDPRLPSAMKSQAWAERLLSTQLTSWAHLRHNTLLYAKQSYSVSIVCEFPDVYVEPYPEFWRGLERLARRGEDAAKLIGQVDTHQGERAARFFERYARASARLGVMAERQLQGKPVTREDLAWMNEMIQLQQVRVGGGCGGGGGHLEERIVGWLRELHYQPWSAEEYRVSIADVHTDPENLRVLHVGTGTPRTLVVIVDGPGEPRAFVGLTGSFYEKVTEGMQRLTNTEWERMLPDEQSPSWTQSFTAAE